MRIILNGVNGRYLREINDSSSAGTEYVEAAVAYASEVKLLFDWCWDNEIPLRYWGRLDDSLPISVSILHTFVGRRSPNFVCKLVTHFHSKVIWWHGMGAYIGSANLSDAAWYGNIEAGCFFPEAEMIASGLDLELRQFFDKVDEVSTPLSAELLKAIELRSRELQQIADNDRSRRVSFMNSIGIRQWQGLLRESSRSAKDKQKKLFLDEWFSTLQTLRDIGETIAHKHRPNWLSADIPAGAQADQFLHAHYHSKVIDENRRSRFAEFHEVNKANPARALSQAIAWWGALARPPSNEDRMLLDWAPFLRNCLSEERLSGLSLPEFTEVCQRVWSIRDHARRVSNSTLNLSGETRHDIETKTVALAKFLFTRSAGNGSSVLETLHYVLYGGRDDALPERLWNAVISDDWKIEHLGISALGEIVGWALPEKFPPRNNRTSKSLRAMGYSVSVHGS